MNKTELINLVNDHLKNECDNVIIESAWNDIKWLLNRAEPIHTTKCACCGKEKECPLRRDEMDGYVCLTCVDKRLDEFDKFENMKHPNQLPSLDDVLAHLKEHASATAINGHMFLIKKMYEIIEKFGSYDKAEDYSTVAIGTGEIKPSLLKIVRDGCISEN